jgi:hypothetical protein
MMINLWFLLWSSMLNLVQGIAGLESGASLSGEWLLLASATRDCRGGG